MTTELPVLLKLEDVWLVKIEKTNGKVQTYRCATEEQAKQLALILAPRDTTPN